MLEKFFIEANWQMEFSVITVQLSKLLKLLVFDII